ncbi:phage tail protein [Riemerella anatipestifer]|uniref:tape measure protein n=1 Tax=Riemerella anatipestifer TaxID=34085 RepID=UPI0012B1A16F|nr:tape measure protein [Riemerella anatipestifer]MSN82687.1 phage tail protein [Riemerella anatipestifer]
MNTNNGGLFFGAAIDMTQWRKDLREIQADILGLNQKTQEQTRQMDTSFKNLSISIASYFSGQALMGFTRQLINVRGEFQKTEIAFSTMLKSKEKASQLMGQMVDLAAKTPFGFNDVTEGAKRLLAFQVPAEQVTETLTRMGNIAAGLGVPMGQLIHVYGQVKTQGKMMTNDLYQFMNAGIPILSELGKVLGKSEAEIKDMVSAGKIGFPEVQAVIKNMTDEGGLFFNLMEEQSKTLSGKVANLEDAFDQMLNKIGEGSEGLLNSGIEGATYLVEHYEDVIDVLTILVATYGSYRAALIVTSVLQKAQIAQQAISNWLSLAKSIRTAKDAQALFNLTTSANPIGAIIALIGLLATTYVTYGDEIKKIIGITNEYDEINKELSKTLSEIDQKGTEEISTLGKLYKVATDDKKSREERLAATKRLQNEYPSYFGNLSAEIIMAGKAANAYNSLREAIIASAKARAIRSKIEEIEKERLEGEAELINKKEEILKKYRKGKKEGWKDETVNYGRDEFGKSNIVTFRGEDNKKALASQFVDVNKRLKEYQKETEKQTQVFADMAEEQERISAKYNADRQKREEEEAKKQQTSLSNTANETKKKAKAHQKALAEVYSKNSIKDLEERISLWNNALERATKDKDGNYQVKVRAKDKYGKEYETGQVVSKDKALEELKVLNEAKAKIEEEFRIKSTEEELAELKRRINLRDKYLQLGMNRPELINEDTVNNLFPDLKDKSYVQVLEEKRKAYLGLIEAQKATEQTTIDLIFIENELKNANGTETFMQGVNDRVSELKERYKGAELIDKLKKDKSLQLGGTEEENLERNKAYASALKEAQKDYDRFYRDLLEQQKTYEEKSLELQKEYTALKATERYKNASEEEQKKIDKHYKKEQSKLDIDAFKESGDWALAFSDLEYMSQSTIERVIKNFEDFKRAKEQNLEPTELRELNDTLNKLRARAGNNPFTGIISGVKGYVQANKDAKTAQDEYNATVEKFGKNSPQAQEAYRKMTDAEQEAIKAKQLLNAQLQKGQDIFNATMQGVMDLADAFGGMDDATKDAIEDITAVGNAAFDLAKSISSGNIAGMITAGVKLIGSIIKALNGDKKRERNIKRWAQALEEVKEQYRALEHQISKTLGENVYKEQGKIIANLRQQQQMLQRMANEEAGKKKSDSGKIAEYRNQANEIDRQITDIIDKMKNDIAQTDAKSLADKMGDALFEAWQRGEDGAKAYEKTVDDVMRNAAKAALKQKLLEGPMKKLIDDMVSKMGFGGGDASIEAEIKKKESRLEEIQNEIKNGNIVQKTISAVKAMALKAQIEKLKKQYEDSKNINPNGSFDGLTPEEREEIKNQGKVAMNNYMEALKQYQDLFGAAEENADSLKGGIKGMSEETAGILAGQFNAIRIHVAEIQKNQGFGLDIAKSSLMNLTKIEENTRNLYQMRKDLSEMNSKIKSNDTRGLGL